MHMLQRIYSRQKILCGILLGISCLIWITGMVFGIWCKNHIPDSGMAGLKKPEDVYATGCTIDYVFGKNKRDEKSKYRSFRDYEEEYVEEVAASPIILVGKSTGSLIQYGSSLGQEVEVERVYKGDKLLEGKKIMVYQRDGIENRKKGLKFMGIRNLMQKNSRYAIFLKENPYYNSIEKAIWNLEDGYFSYLNLKDVDKKPIKWTKDTPLSEYSDTEFFATSDRLLKQLKRIKREILERTII